MNLDQGPAESQERGVIDDIRQDPRIDIVVDAFVAQRLGWTLDDAVGEVLPLVMQHMSRGAYVVGAMRMLERIDALAARQADGDTVADLRRQLEAERLAHATAISTREAHVQRAVTAAMEEIEQAFHERSRQRAESASGGDSAECDGDCGNGDCHTTSAVAAWSMAAAAVRRRLEASGFCCADPKPVRDPGEPDEHVIECGTCGADMDEDMLNRWRAQVGA